MHTSYKSNRRSPPETNTHSINFERTMTSNNSTHALIAALTVVSVQHLEAETQEELERRSKEYVDEHEHRLYSDDRMPHIRFLQWLLQVTPDADAELGGGEEQGMPQYLGKHNLSVVETAARTH